MTKQCSALYARNGPTTLSHNSHNTKYAAKNDELSSNFMHLIPVYPTYSTKHVVFTCTQKLTASNSAYCMEQKTRIGKKN